MPETVKLPGIGAVDQRWAVAGVALVVGIVGYAWWKRASVTVDTTTTAEPTADALQDASVDAYQGAFGTPALTPHPTSEPGYLPPSTDAEWSRRAQDILTGINYDPVVAAAAIGKYIGRQQLASADAEIVRVAIAQLGPPPVGSYPVNVVETPPKSESPQVLWDVWQGQQVASGNLVLPGATGAQDWGMIARGTLGPNATKLDVYLRALELQKVNPEIHGKYPMYVPPNIVPSIRRA